MDMDDLFYLPKEHNLARVWHLHATFRPKKHSG